MERWTPKLKQEQCLPGFTLRMWTDKDGEYVLYTDHIAETRKLIDTYDLLISQEDKKIAELEAENKRLQMMNPCNHTGFESAPCDVCGYPDPRKLIARLKYERDADLRIEYGYSQQTVYDKILDTHGGSCSIAIACDIMGFDLDCYEIDLDYWTAATERFQRHKRQEVLPL